jgi:hypothetical protein
VPTRSHSQYDRDCVRLANDQVIRARADNIAVSLEQLVGVPVLFAPLRLQARPQACGTSSDRAGIAGERMKWREPIREHGQRQGRQVDRCGATEAREHVEDAEWTRPQCENDRRKKQHGNYASNGTRRGLANDGVDDLQSTFSSCFEARGTQEGPTRAEVTAAGAGLGRIVERSARPGSDIAGDSLRGDDEVHSAFKRMFLKAAKAQAENINRDVNAAACLHVRL